MGNNNFQQFDFFAEETFHVKKTIAELTAVIRRDLDSKGISLKTYRYKDDKKYKEIRDNRIDGLPGGAMSLEEFVDRFMHTNYTFESIYDMGNPNEIEDSDCTDDAVATEIWNILYPESVEITEADICNGLERENGLSERIKKYLGIDLNKLDKNDNREKRERSKILYFFYILEHRHYPHTNVLMLLDKPSMESIDNTFLGWQTHNGKIIRTVKEALGKELPLDKKDRIYSDIAAISIEWDNILKNVRLLLDFLCDYGFDYASAELLQSPTSNFIRDEDSRENTCQYPVERLYFIVSKREYLGNLFDITFVNEIQNSNNYDVPPELVEEMKSLIHKPVDFNNVGKHIKDHALRLSRYVYLGKKATKEDIRRIRTFAHKFQKFLNFCYRTNCVADMKENSNELQIVSFLQAVILDDQSEAFDYTYHNYQEKAKHMMRVQAALKNDKSVPDALKVYWVRKVADRWYANVGKYDVRLKLRQIEQACDEIRAQILSQPTLEDMKAAHDFYMGQIDPGFFNVESQTQAVVYMIKYLQMKGFEYKDHACKIRYAFLDSKDCGAICCTIQNTIEAAIEGHERFCQIECEAKSPAARDAGFYLDLEFDYYKKNCTLTRFTPVFG